MQSIMEVTFFTGGMAQTNGWLAQTRAGTIAVDAPEGMADWLAGQGVTVNTLLLTHQHFDHVQDAARIQREHGARILAFAHYSPDLTLEALMAAVTGMSIAVQPFQVDQLLQGGSEIEAGGASWSLAHIPGHSPDSITFHCRAEGILFAGDVLFSGSIGRTDFPGGSMAELVQGIHEKLLPLSDDTRVLPGHGPETSIGEERVNNPYLI
jgi:glyoxylase-like metal-dependent hydrolase (beta-lactamase superfamily II)